MNDSPIRDPDQIRQECARNGDYLVAIADPQHEQYVEMIDWRGPFDPEAFDAK